MTLQTRMNAIRWFAVVAMAALTAGCGMIADQDRIEVARFGDVTFTRGDLFQVIREMPAQERPVIRTRDDMYEVLRNHIDNEIRLRLGLRLDAEGRINVPRDRARAEFARRHPELMIDIANPEEFGIDPAMVGVMEDEREFGIDRIHDRMLGEAAVFHRIREAVEAGALTVSEEEYEREYNRRKGELVHPERITLRGLFFPETLGNAMNKAVEARQQLDEDAEFDEVRDGAVEHGAQPLPRTQLVNDPADPSMQRYYRFWQSASGSEADDVVGPVLIQSPEIGRRGPGGQVQFEQLPDSYLVAEVIEQTPEREKTFEEARDELATPILYDKMMERLREEWEVEIYRENLPDPAMLEQDRPGPVAEHE